MAKIYETQEDVQRDELIRTSNNLRNKQYGLLISGLLTGAIGKLLASVDELKQDKLGVFTQDRWRTDNVISWFTSVIGLGEIIASVFVRHKAVKAEEKLKKIGKQEKIIVLETSKPDKSEVVQNISASDTWKRKLSSETNSMHLRF